MSDMTVTVAVVTYRRPRDLAELLPLLIEQIETVPHGWTASLVVVDNDPAASAAFVLLDVDRTDVRYVPEQRPGIAAARNRALVEGGDSDFLAFIDDDERPSPTWLRSLLETGREFGAAAVVGPVVTDYRPEDIDPWIVAGGFLDRHHHADRLNGSELADAATNNLLLDLRVLRAEGLRFDESFGLTGGEDTLFTRVLAGRGHRIVWCVEAVVGEKIRPERLTRRWMRSRALSYGNTDARVAAELAGPRGSVRRTLIRLISAVQGLVRIAVGSVLSALGLLGRSLGRQAYGQQMLYRGWGLVLGACGVTHQRYRRPAAADVR